VKGVVSIEHLFPLIKKKTKTSQRNGVKTKTVSYLIPLEGGDSIDEDLMALNGVEVELVSTHSSAFPFVTTVNGKKHKLKKSWVRISEVDIDQAELTVLSFGGGQDSTAILHMIEQDKSFREKYANGRVLVIMSDTGNEHPETNRHVKNIQAKTGLEFVFIDPKMGYHGENWSSLQASYKFNNSIGSKAYPKVCTDRLKLQPIYKFLEDWIEKEYGYKADKKNGFKEFAKHHGKINMIIGIAAGEEGRMADGETPLVDFREFMIDAATKREKAKLIKEEKKRCKETGEKWKGARVKYTPASWKTAAIHMSYPLVELGLDRKGCQEKIAELGHEVPVPSNCIMCPFMDDIELIWLERFLPHEFQKWVALEDNKFKANEHVGDRNLGVWGKWNKKENKPYGLRDALADAKKKHGELTDAFVEDYKMSHGHCLMSKY
jgi:hypothetical protein